MCGIKCRHRLAVALVGLCTLLLLYCCSGQASAAAITGEATYMITQSELNQLSSNLTRLQTINSDLRQTSGALRNQLVDCQTELAQAQEQLTAAEKQSMELRNQLTALTEKSMSQDALLIQVNQSFQRYSSEQKKTRLRIKAQRNTWLTVSLVAATAAIIR